MEGDIVQMVAVDILAQASLVTWHRAAQPSVLAIWSVDFVYLAHTLGSKTKVAAIGGAINYDNILKL